MQPFFSYYGGKWKLAKQYVRPRCEHVIEPFAGAAGYSVYWEPKKVTLIERNPKVYGVWKFLQRVSPAELMRLPSNIAHIDELPSRVCPEAKWLIGFWFDNGLTSLRSLALTGRARQSRQHFSGARASNDGSLARLITFAIGKSSKGVTRTLPTSKLIGTLTRRTITPPAVNTRFTPLTEDHWRNGVKVVTVGFRFAKMTVLHGYRLGRFQF